MKIEMEMHKCNINRMNFMEGITEEVINGNVFVYSGGLVCNSVVNQQGEAGVILVSNSPMTNTVWIIMDLANGFIMIRDISTNLYWTTRTGGITIELAPLSNDEGVFQLFKRTDFMVDMEEFFYLDATGNRMVGYPQVPPRPGDALVLTEREEDRGVFRTVRG